MTKLENENRCLKEKIKMMEEKKGPIREIKKEDLTSASSKSSVDDNLIEK